MRNWRFEELSHSELSLELPVEMMLLAQSSQRRERQTDGQKDRNAAAVMSSFSGNLQNSLSCLPRPSGKREEKPSSHSHSCGDGAVLHK